MKRIDILRKRRSLLVKEIMAGLDYFLIGTVAKSPSMFGYSLTTKVEGKTITRYVRKDIVTKAVEMTKQYKKLWILMQKLSRINWEILRQENG